MIPEPRRVVGRRTDTVDTVTLELEPIAASGPQPAPGQFAMLWPFGAGEAAVSYSGIGDGRSRHTIRAVGSTTTALCALGVGDVVGARGPFGRGWDLAACTDRPTVVVAGGLGLAPLRPAIEQLAAEAPGRLTVLVGARDPGQLLYGDDLARWEAAGADVRTTVDHALAGWSGRVGVVTELFDGLALTPGTASLVCGPETMMRYAAAGLVDAGVHPDDVQVSLERNMDCAVGHCGHCQLGPLFVCRDGPVLSWSAVAGLVAVADR